MKSIILFLIMIAFTTIPALASVELGDLGVKIDYAKPTNQSFDALNSDNYVGTCGGKRFTDYSSFVGCQRVADASTMNIAFPVKNPSTASTRPLSMVTFPSQTIHF